MAESAQGTVNSLLGNLANVLRDEARLVRSVHSEVQFIKDEMESMYGFLLDSEAEQRSDDASTHQVRAWTKQVKELAYGSQECVDKYVTSVVARPQLNGLMSYIIKMPIHVLKTLPSRRRIASQIRELRVRVQEVGERRLRYGIEISRAVTDTMTNKQPSSEERASGEGDTGTNQVLEDERRSKLVLGVPADLSTPRPFHNKKNIKRISDQLMIGAMKEEERQWLQQQQEEEQERRRHPQEEERRRRPHAQSRQPQSRQPQAHPREEQQQPHPLPREEQQQPHAQSRQPQSRQPQAHPREEQQQPHPLPREEQQQPHAQSRQPQAHPREEQQQPHPLPREEQQHPHAQLRQPYPQPREEQQQPHPQSREEPRLPHLQPREEEQQPHPPPREEQQQEQQQEHHHKEEHEDMEKREQPHQHEQEGQSSAAAATGVATFAKAAGVATSDPSAGVVTSDPSAGAATSNPLGAATSDPSVGAGMIVTSAAPAGGAATSATGVAAHSQTQQLSHQQEERPQSQQLQLQLQKEQCKAQSQQLQPQPQDEQWQQPRQQRQQQRQELLQVQEEQWQRQPLEEQTQHWQLEEQWQQPPQQRRQQEQQQPQPLEEQTQQWQQQWQLQPRQQYPRQEQPRQPRLQPQQGQPQQEEPQQQQQEQRRPQQQHEQRRPQPHSQVQQQWQHRPWLQQEWQQQQWQQQWQQQQQQQRQWQQWQRQQQEEQQWQQQEWERQHHWQQRHRQQHPFMEQAQLQQLQQEQRQQQSYKVFLTKYSGKMHVRELARAIIKGEDHYSVMDWFDYISYVSVPVQYEGRDNFISGMFECMWCRHCRRENHDCDCMCGQKLLVFVEGIASTERWMGLLELLDILGCANGSAIVLLAPGDSLGFRTDSSLEVIQPNPMIPDYLEKASGLLQDYHGDMDHLLINILARLCPHDFKNGWGLKMFMHFLYAKPTCTREELVKLQDELTPKFTKDNISRVITSCYSELSRDHQRRLMYLTTFLHSQNTSPVRSPISRARATRQWVFHSQTSDKGDTSATALHEADRYFNTLLSRGFISPVSTSSEGKVKTFETPKLIMDFLLSRRGSDGDSSYEKWCHHDEIRKITKTQFDCDDAESRCFHAKAPCLINYHLDRDPFSTNELVRDLLASPRIGGVEVLDLQGCKGLKKQHLRRICTIMIFLKYLSIRDTDVEELPSVIENLNYLEMLDIRETKVRVFTSRVIKVKRLKHLLAGKKDSNGSFSTLSLSSAIGSMSNLEVLSHVQVPSDGMIQLRGLRLRKLGVLLHANKDDFKAFLSAISEMCGTLQSLSIHIEVPVDFQGVGEEPIFKPPVNLRSLSISGIKHALPTWIKELQQLEKVTLQDTFFTESGFNALGELTGLRKLRIHKNSCLESNKLTFAEEQFKSLKFLLVDCPQIEDIVFTAGAAPEVQYVTWSFVTLRSISGVEHLPGIKEFMLKGARSSIQRAAKNVISNYPNKSVFKHI